MPDTETAISAEQSRVHDAVRLLRTRLAELGLPDDQIRQILPVTDTGRRAYVRLGTVTVESAELLLAALGADAPVTSRGNRPGPTEGHRS